jgi:hypothetical protein
MSRDFKGIWIPKEVWLSKDLTLQEKVFLVEIDSLDNEHGCYATNKYFSEFFELSEVRVSEVISSLVQKGYIVSSINKSQGNKRKLKTLLKKSLRPSQTKVEDPLKDSFMPLYNNTINNTINNTYSFDDFWDLYDKKVGNKDKLRGKYEKLSLQDRELIFLHVPKYKSANPDKQYRKNPETYLNNKSWLDEIIMPVKIETTKYQPTTQDEQW